MSEPIKDFFGMPMWIGTMVEKTRNDTIEECAQVAASFHAFEVADAIRALKDSDVKAG